MPGAWQLSVREVASVALGPGASGRMTVTATPVFQFVLSRTTVGAETLHSESGLRLTVTDADGVVFSVKLTLTDAPSVTLAVAGTTLTAPSLSAMSKVTSGGFLAL